MTEIDYEIFEHGDNVRIIDYYAEVKAQQEAYKASFMNLVERDYTYNTGRTGSPLFAAMYKGKCKECDDRWEEGDEIGYAEGHPGPLCSDCHDLLDTFDPYGGY